MKRELTGRDVLLITVGAFSVIIGVNITLAVSAVKTFPGLEVKNSYVASQEFDTRRAAQLALGWTARLTYAPGTLSLAFTDASGAPILPAALDATLGRATEVTDDFTPAFTAADGLLTAPADLAPGHWELRFTATAPDGTEFRQRLEIDVRPPR